MTPVPFKFDEIGYWSELKLEIVEKYGSAYTTAFKNTGLKKYYIDGLCGAGIHFSKKTATQVEGSPSRALKIFPPFDTYYFNRYRQRENLVPSNNMRQQKRCAHTYRRFH